MFDDEYKIYFKDVDGKQKVREYDKDKHYIEFRECAMIVGKRENKKGMEIPLSNILPELVFIIPINRLAKVEG